MAKLGFDLVKLGLGKARRKRTPRKNKNKNASPVPSEGLPSSARDGAAFEFQKRVARIDWRTLLAVDVDRVIREVDIDTLESVLDVVAFGDIQGEDTRNFTESNFVKIFRLAQLMVEYLLHVQDLLADHKNGLLQSRANMEQKNEKIRSRFYSQRDALLQTRHELRQAKKALQTYEVMLKVQGNNQTSQINKPQVWHCPFCEKAFESSFYLDTHVARHHENKQGMTDDKIQALVSKAEAVTAEKVKAEMSFAVQAEIQRLRERYQADLLRAETNSNTQVRTLQEDLKQSNNQLHEVQTRLEVLQAQVQSAPPNRLHELESKFSGLERQVKTLGQENSRLLKDLNVAYAEVSKRQSVFTLETQIEDLRKENQHLKRNKSKVSNIAVQAGFMSNKPERRNSNQKERSKSYPQSPGNGSLVCESSRYLHSSAGSTEVPSKALEGQDGETSHVASPGHWCHEIPEPILAIIEEKEEGVPECGSSPLTQSFPGRPDVSSPLSKLNFSGGVVLTNMIEDEDEALRALARPKPRTQKKSRPISAQSSEPSERESSPHDSAPVKRALRFLTPEKPRVSHKQRPNSASAANKVKWKAGTNPATVEEMRAKLEWELAAAHDEQTRRQRAVQQLLSKEDVKEKLEEKKGKRTKCDPPERAFKPSKFEAPSEKSMAPPLPQPRNEETKCVDPGSSTIHVVRKLVSNRADVIRANPGPLIPAIPGMHRPFPSAAPYDPDPGLHSNIFRARVHPYLRRGMGIQPPPPTSFHMAVLSSNPAASSNNKRQILDVSGLVPPSKEHIIERLSAVTRELGKYFPVAPKAPVKARNVQPRVREVDTPKTASIEETEEDEDEDEDEERIAPREDVEMSGLRGISEGAAMDVGEAAQDTTMTPCESETETGTHEGTEKDFSGQLREELKKFGITSTTNGISDATYKSISSALDMQRSVRMSQIQGEKRHIVEKERNAVVWHTQMAVRGRDLETSKASFEAGTDHSGSDHSSRAEASEDSAQSARSNRSEESVSEPGEGEGNPGSPSEQSSPQSSVVSENSDDGVPAPEAPHSKRDAKFAVPVDWAKHGRVPRPPSPDGRGQPVSRTRSWEPTLKKAQNRDCAPRGDALNRSRQSEGEETETDFGLGDWESD